MEQNYIQQILCKILALQNQEFDLDNSGCDRPFLGPSPAITNYNTRPVMLYNRYTAEAWSFAILNETTTTNSNLFRIEALEDNTVTVRLLSEAEDGSYTSTNQFVTIQLSSIGAIRCLPDVFITL